MSNKCGHPDNLPKLKSTMDVSGFGIYGAATQLVHPQPDTQKKIFLEINLNSKHTNKYSQF